jgi:hypothetical protein
MPELVLGLRAEWQNQNEKLLQALGELKQLNTQIAENTAAHQQAKQAAREHEDALSGLTSKAVGLAAQFLSVGAAIQFVWSAFKAGVDADKLMTQLAANARIMGNATDAQVAGLKSWVESIQHAGGLMKEELVPAVTTLMAATHDLTSAQMLVEVASGAAARGVGTFEGNVTSLARALETGMLRGVSPFTQELRAMLKGSEDISKALPELIKKYGDAGAAVDTVAMRLRRQKVEWETSKEAMGHAVEAITSVAAPVIKTFAYGLGLVEAGIIKLGGAFASFFHWMKTGKEDITIMQKANEAADHALQGVADAFEGVTDAATRSKKAEEDALKVISKQIEEKSEKNKKAKEEELTHNKEVTEKLKALRLELDNQDIKLGIEALARTKDELAKMLELTRLYAKNRSAILAAQEEVDERLAKTKEGKALADAMKPKAEKKFGDKGAIDPLTGLSYAEGERLFAASRKKDEANAYASGERMDHITRLLADKKKHWTQREVEDAKAALEAIDEQGIIYAGKDADRKEAEAKLAKLTAQTALDVNTQAVAGALDTMANAFPQNKAFAVASAIMNTYEGATKALAQGGFAGIIMAAAVIASGLAQVAKIESTEPGGGGGGGGAAAAPRIGAVTMPAVVAGASGGSTYHQSTSNVNAPVNVNINTLMGDKAVATTREVQRILQPGERAYARTTLNQPSASMGSARNA